jgi:hypothetical protein
MSTFKGLRFKQELPEGAPSGTKVACTESGWATCKASVKGIKHFIVTKKPLKDIFFLTGFYSPYRTMAFLNGLLDPQTFGRTPWLGDQSNTRPLPTHRTTQHGNTHTSMS